MSHPELSLGDARLPSAREHEARRLVARNPGIVEKLVCEAELEIASGVHKITADFIRYALNCRLQVDVSHNHSSWMLRALWKRGSAALLRALPRCAAHADGYENYPL